jgi:hypothetical protein
VGRSLHGSAIEPSFSKITQGFGAAWKKIITHYQHAMVLHHNPRRLKIAGAALTHLHCYRKAAITCSVKELGNVVGTVRITFGILLSNVSAQSLLHRREGGPFLCLCGFCSACL